jgi:hypothetical protein
VERDRLLIEWEDLRETIRDLRASLDDNPNTAGYRTG